MIVTLYEAAQIAKILGSAGRFSFTGDVPEWAELGQDAWYGVAPGRPITVMATAWNGHHFEYPLVREVPLSEARRCLVSYDNEAPYPDEVMALATINEAAFAAGTVGEVL